MSILFGIFLLVFSGWVILTELGVHFQRVEKLAYALLTGIGLQSIWMLLSDLVHVQFSQLLLTVFNLGLIVLLADFDAIRKFDFSIWIKERVKELKAYFLQPDIGSLVVLATIAGLVFLIASKGLYWPTSEHDAIGTFDKLGIWFALEGKIHVSLYDVGLQGAGGVYPPLFPSSIAFSYLFGGNNPKIMTLLFYVATLVVFFYALRRYTTSLAALIFTLVLAWAPEYYSHAALLLSNLPSVAYVGASSLSLFIWYKEKKQPYFVMFCIMMAFALFLRQDLLPFAVAGGLVVLLAIFKTKQWKYAIILSLVVFVSFFSWSLYVKFGLNLSAAERFGLSSMFHIHKLKMLMGYMWAYLGLGQKGNSPPGYFLYGLAFLLPITLAIFNIKNIRKDNPIVLVYLFVSLLLYAILFLLIDEQAQKAPLQSLLESSFKRGLFCFMPAALFYAGTTTLSKRVFEKIELYRKG